MSSVKALKPYLTILGCIQPYFLEKKTVLMKTAKQVSYPLEKTFL